MDGLNHRLHVRDGLNHRLHVIDGLIHRLHVIDGLNHRLHVIDGLNHRLQIHIVTHTEKLSCRESPILRFFLFFTKVNDLY